MIGAIEAEQGVIGSILFEPKCFPIVFESLEPTDFLSETTREIYEAMVSLQKDGEMVDLLLIINRMKKLGTFSDEKSKMMVQCMEITPTANNVSLYVGIVAESAKLRRLKDILEESMRSLLSHENSFEVAASLISKVTEANSKEKSQGLVSMQDAIIDFFENRNKIDSGEIKTIRTGYPILDKVLGGGYFNGGLHLIAARPGIGKSTFAINMAKRIARLGKRVFYVSLEMTVFDMICKMISTESGVSASELMMAKLGDDEPGKYIRVAESAKKFDSLSISFYNPRSGMPDVSRIVSCAQVEKFDVIIIDYVGLMKKEYGKNSQEKMAATSAALKQAALQLNVPIIALAQLNREVEGRPTGRPRVSDLRDSGQLEADADTIILLEMPRQDREENPLPDTEPEELIAHVAKNRRGRITGVKYDFYMKQGVICECRK